MQKDTFNSQLSEAISALSTPNFTPKLMQLIGSIFCFDCAVILGYREGKRPIYLYDSIDNGRELLFQRYLTASFQHDPFFQRLNRDKHQGVFTLKDVVKKDLDYQSYCNEFYKKTGWKDELSIQIEIEPKRWIIMCFGYLSQDKWFTKKQVNQLNLYFSIIQSLCQQHWKSAELHLAEPKYNPALYPDPMQAGIKHALATFGADLLTAREYEITILIVQGIDTKQIAKQLEITEGTVKNHRKRIYTRLNVASLSELFQLFFNHLVTHKGNKLSL